MEPTMFEKLLAQNVNEYTEKKNGLTYLSWVYAWKEFKKVYPKATYEIVHFEDGEKPYLYDENLGYMVETEVDNGEGMVLSMWLPVMDGANKAMKDKPYTYKVKKYENYKWTGEYEDKEVQPATMFDINTAIMRCLVKNIAMFGLGLYIYAGEDLPDELFQPMTKEQRDELIKLGTDMTKVLEYLHLSKEEEIDFKTADALIKAKKLKESKNA